MPGGTNSQAAPNPPAHADGLHRVPPLVIHGFLVLWAAAILAGMALLMAYAARPGPAARSPHSWPGGATIERDHDSLTLVMFVHPRCPCSRATIHELERALLPGAPRVSTHIVFVIPHGMEPGPSPLHDLAAALPGVTLHDDPDGREAHRFGASTSGTTLLYSAAGRLLFSGGLTASRGHEGDNVGRDLLSAAIRSGTPSPAATPIFGCPLNDPEVAQACPECDP